MGELRPACAFPNHGTARGERGRAGHRRPEETPRSTGETPHTPAGSLAERSRPRVSSSGRATAVSEDELGLLLFLKSSIFPS